MTINAYVTTPKLQRRLHEGPLGIHIDLYAAQLLKEGHCRQSAWRCLRVVSDFSHWLDRKHISLAEVDEQIVERYQEFRLRNRCPFGDSQGHSETRDTAAGLCLLGVSPAVPGLRQPAHWQRLP